MSPFTNYLTRTAGLVAAAALGVTPLGAADADELSALREQLRALEQKILVLERKQELKDQAATAAASSAPKVTINDRGVTIASADAANAVRVRGLVQLDSRHYFGDEGTARDTYVLRRARLITEGVFARNYSVQLVSEFGGSGNPSILDANLNIAWTKALQFRLGKFKSPVGLEQLQSDTWTFFNERSIVSNLVPNRDLGVQAWGELADGRVQYAAGVFNGVPDGASTTNTDFDSDKDLVGRVVVSPLPGLSVGLSGSIGREKTTAGRAAGYRTDGQQTFFTYNASVIADGKNWRVSPHFDYRVGPFGLLGEYVISTTNVRPAAGAPIAELQNKAWQIAAGYVLTGENSSPNGVVPRTNLSRKDGTWGAFEVVARVANLDIDNAAFPLFASSAASASEATSFGLGLNWYLSKAVAFKIDYYQTDFDLAAGAPAVPTAAVLRQDEKAFITRFQIGF